MCQIIQKGEICMKHMTLNDRISIQEGLDNGYSIRTIARTINKSPSTVMHEIEKHKSVKGKRRPDLLDECALKRNCSIYHLCQGLDCNSQCKTCEKCKTVCPNYSPAKCELIRKSPYVCNGCAKYNLCMYSRIIYLATYAQNCYEETLISTREGLNIEPDTLQQLDELVSPLILKGQSIAHIHQNHKTEIPCSKSTLYNYVDKHIFTAKNIDLPRKVKYKKRKTNRTKLSEETKMSILARNYDRFLDYINKNPDLPVVEMDTVIGTQTSEKVLLTLLFRSCNLMLIYLLEHKSQECVINALNDLSDALGIELFQKLFPVILTDRGTEFLFPEALECDRNGEIKTKIFYCDPQASWQKPQIERNHEFIRFVLPKGHSFDYLCQDDINLLRDHINSYSRPQYNGSTPYQLSKLLIDNKLHDALKLTYIAPDDVMLKPALLKNR